MVTKQMELKDILSVSIASLIVLVIAHITVFWVVRTLYPPLPSPVPVMYSAPAPVPPPAPAPAPAPITFIEPPSIEQQDVTVPTFEASVFPKPISKEELRGGFPPAEATAIQRDSGMVISNP